jgi:xanthine/uracil permease
MLRKINAVLIVIGAITLIFAWFNNISVQTELIPTIVNGEVIATSTAIMFTGIFYTLGCSNRLLELQKKKDYTYFVLALSGCASIFVAGTFLRMMINNFSVALKLKFTV